MLTRKRKSYLQMVVNVNYWFDVSFFNSLYENVVLVIPINWLARASCRSIWVGTNDSCIGQLLPSKQKMKLLQQSCKGMVIYSASKRSWGCWLWVCPMARMCCTRFSSVLRWCIGLHRLWNCLCLLWILILAFLVSYLGDVCATPMGSGVWEGDFVVRRWPFGKLRDHAAVTTNVWPLRGLFCLIFEYHFEAFEYHFALLEYHFGGYHRV